MGVFLAVISRPTPGRYRQRGAGLREAGGTAELRPARPPRGLPRQGRAGHHWSPVADLRRRAGAARTTRVDRPTAMATETAPGRQSRPCSRTRRHMPLPCRSKMTGGAGADRATSPRPVGWSVDWGYHRSTARMMNSARRRYPGRLGGMVVGPGPASDAAFSVRSQTASGSWGFVGLDSASTAGGGSDEHTE